MTSASLTAVPPFDTAVCQVRNCCTGVPAPRHVQQQRTSAARSLSRSTDCSPLCCLAGLGVGGSSRLLQPSTPSEGIAIA